MKRISYGARGREALEGSKRMGCEVELLGLKDTSIRDSDEAVERLRRSMDSFRPDTILTHWFDDMLPDHEATFRVLRRPFVCGFLGNSIDDIKDIPRIFCCDTYNSIGLHGPFEPDNLVDVSRVWEKKKGAIKAHESQPFSIFMDMNEQQCLAHGRAAGLKLAEGFLYLPLFGRPDGFTGSPHTLLEKLSAIRLATFIESPKKKTKGKYKANYQLEDMDPDMLELAEGMGVTDMKLKSNIPFSVYT